MLLSGPALQHSWRDIWRRKTKETQREVKELFSLHSLLLCFQFQFLQFAESGVTAVLSSSVVAESSTTWNMTWHQLTLSAPEPATQSLSLPVPIGITISSLLHLIAGPLFIHIPLSLGSHLMSLQPWWSSVVRRFQTRIALAIDTQYDRIPTLLRMITYSHWSYNNLHHH